MVEKVKPTLRDEQPDLDKKLKLILPVGFISSRNLTKDDVLRGLDSSVATEFFVRCFATDRNTKALTDAMGDEKVRDAVYSMAEKNSTALKEEILKRIGGGLCDIIPKHMISACRFAGFLAENAELYRRFVSTEDGNVAA
ncbi:MAG: hypothetical protein V1744_04820, partial [Candidatus Altiarchaeota archaeon]